MAWVPEKGRREEKEGRKNERWMVGYGCIEFRGWVSLVDERCRQLWIIR